MEDSQINLNDNISSEGDNGGNGVVSQNQNVHKENKGSDTLDDTSRS
jgi:hypothetical protein